MTAVVLAEEIPASKVARVTHQEGYTVETASFVTGEALVWLKGASKPTLMVVFQKGRKGAQRCFTSSRPSPEVVVGEGEGFKVVVDSKKKVVRVTDGVKTVEEKFTAEIDS